MKNALLVIDVQNDYFPGGRMELVGADAALAQVEALLNGFRAARLPVVHVQHINTRPGAGFFLPDTEGVRIHPRLAPAAGEPVVVKHVPNAFHQTGLRALLDEQGVGMLTVCGMMTHMCIDTTVRAAKDFALPITLAHDATATRDLGFGTRTVPAAQVQTAYLAALSGMFAQVVPAQEALAAIG
jgi:nicotinamidase-related amidase